MNMTDWATREVEIACKREHDNSSSGEWDYGCACYESALKAFKVLMEDGHSGYSFGITKSILNRLMNHKPLTPIEDTDDVWNDVTYSSIDGYKTTYQCTRMTSLFKDVYPDGTVSYHDIDRVICYYNEKNDICWSNGFISNLVHEMFPITMPYAPDNVSIKAICSEFLSDSRNGDYDTIGVLFLIMPDGNRIDVNRYFKEGPNTWIEIEENEYLDRYNHRVDK